MTELDPLIDCNEIWELADPLHALKCQRCRLVRFLTFSPGSRSFCARTLDETLGIGEPLERLTGADRMNDPLAVLLFTMENCLKLLFAGQFAEFCYLLPFAMWFNSLYYPEIPLSCREQTVEFCFRCLCEWLRRAPHGIRQWPNIENSEPPSKYVAELPDLRRYLNSFPFFYELLTTHNGALALNRIGTHPVENMFGLIRMKCKWKRHDTAFLRAVSHSMVMATILKVTEMSSPVKRDYSNAGSKIVLTTQDDRTYIGATSVLEWLRHVVGLYIHEARQAGDEETLEQILRELSPTSSFFIRLIEVLIQSGQAVRPVFSLPNPIANQPRLSRISAFSSESAHAGLICSPSKKRKARALLTAAKQPDELRRVAEIVGCKVDELAEVMHQNPTEFRLTGV
jgi:hypothetical protein